MNAVPSELRSLERISRPAPLGIIFWDVATSSAVGDGLSVTIARPDQPDSSQPLFVNRNGVWLASMLPGLSRADVAAGDFTALQRTYRITAVDKLDRFLPLQLDAKFPSRGLYHWPKWASLPKKPLAPLGKSEAGVVSPKRIPLFSAAARSAPPGRAEVRCELVDSVTDKPAAWALVTAKHGTIVRAIGLSDRKGRLALFFDYPERPPATLATAPAAITDYQWKLELKCFYEAPPGPVPELPDLATVMDQLGTERGLLASTVAPQAPLPDQMLSFGRPLVVKTGKTKDGPSSSLFLAAP